jgi:hypothetical protein
VVEEDAVDIEVAEHTSSFCEECKTIPENDDRRKVVDNYCPTDSSEVGGDLVVEKQRKAVRLACLFVLLWSNRDLRAYPRNGKLVETLPDLSDYWENQKRLERSLPTNECFGKAMDLRSLRTMLPTTEMFLCSRSEKNLLLWFQETGLS